MKAEDADVEEVIETTELCKDATNEPVMVKDEYAKKPREAAQTAVEDIPALDFQSTEVKAVENADEPNCAVAIKDILEMSMEVKAEYAEEPEDTPEDEAVDVENSGSASPADTAPCVGLGYQYTVDTTQDGGTTGWRH